MSMNITCNRSSWSKEQNKAFENALAIYFGDFDQWEKITAAVSGKTLEEIKDHYKILVEDINAIESGHVPLPYYDSLFEDCNSYAGGIGISRKVNRYLKMQSDSIQDKKSLRSDQERRKGIAWTEEEHRLFLWGLEKYGKGDWRSISRNVVVTRTPSQVASHAQKYFIRLNSANKERRRSSIHDITNIDDGDTSAPRRPITGMRTEISAAESPTAPNVGVYALPPVEQPTQRSVLSAVGTSAYLPPLLHEVENFRAPDTNPGLCDLDYPMNMPGTYFLPFSSDQQ